MSRMDRIFSEFDDSPSTDVANPVRVNNEDSVFLRIARMQCQELDTEALCSVFALNEAQLSDLMDTQEYADALAVAREEVHERTNNIDLMWDKIEEQALRATAETLDHLDPDRAISVALAANRAKRRTRELPAHAIADKSAGTQVTTVTLNVQNTFIQKIKTQNPHDALQEIVDANRDKKIIDLAKPKRIDELLADKVVEEQMDNDIRDAIGNM